MIANIKDVGATVLVAASLAVVGLNVAGEDVPVIGNVRLAALVALALGLASCITGAQTDTSGSTPSMKTWHDRLGAVLGGLSGLAAIVALIFGWQPALVAYGALVAALWLITTSRHLITPKAAVAA